MDILIWVLGFVLLFIGSYLMFFPEKFLSYDSKLLPNFWDHHGAKDIVLLNWKSRRLVTFIIGIIFLLGVLLFF